MVQGCLKTIVHPYKQCIEAYRKINTLYGVYSPKDSDIIEPELMLIILLFGPKLLEVIRWYCLLHSGANIIDFLFSKVASVKDTKFTSRCRGRLNGYIMSKLHPLFTYGFDVCIQGSFCPFQV